VGGVSCVPYWTTKTPRKRILGTEARGPAPPRIAGAMCHWQSCWRRLGHALGHRNPKGAHHTAAKKKRHGRNKTRRAGHPPSTGSHIATANSVLPEPGTA